MRWLGLNLEREVDVDLVPSTGMDRAMHGH